MWGGTCPPQMDNADHLDFNPECAHLLLKGVYGDFLHHNNGSHLDRGAADDALWQRHWNRLAVQLDTWYATPSRPVGHSFMEILAAE